MKQFILEGESPILREKLTDSMQNGKVLAISLTTRLIKKTV